MHLQGRNDPVNEVVMRKKMTQRTIGLLPKRRVRHATLRKIQKCRKRHLLVFCQTLATIDLCERARYPLHEAAGMMRMLK